MTPRLPGHRLHERFRVLRTLGQGAMGAVYLVEDEKLQGSQWALKELRVPELPSHEQDLAEVLFRREAEILGGIIHPGVPRLIDFLESTDGCLSLVMEWINGTALDEILESLHRPLKAAEAIPIALMVTQVLERLHQQNPPVVFRDLKPSNLMISQSGRVYFIDFGIARHFQSGRAKDTQELGTPGFCAPEQYGHGQSSAASDIYAVGTTLFHFLTTQDPQSFNFNFPKLSTLINVSPGVESAVERCLQLQPKDRFASATALRHDLEKAWEDMPRDPPGATQGLLLYGLNQHPLGARKASGEARQVWKKYLLNTFSLWRSR